MRMALCGLVSELQQLLRYILTVLVSQDCLTILQECFPQHDLAVSNIQLFDDPLRTFPMANSQHLRRMDVRVDVACC